MRAGCYKKTGVSDGLKARNAPEGLRFSPGYLRFWLAVRSNDSFATKVDPHQLDPSPLGLMVVMFPALYEAV